MNHSPFRHLKQNRLLLLLTLISCILVILLTNSTPQGLWSDPAWQLVALKQYLAGESPSLNQRVEPQWQDLSKDYTQWIYWWPPGTQLAAYPLMKTGIALGDTLRIIAIAALIIGSLGWIRWFYLFRLPLWLKIVFAISLPWMPYSRNFLFWYTPDVFVYSLTPWILSAVYRLSLIWNKKKPKLGITLLSALLGLAMGSVYILKYTAVFASLGAAAYLGLIIHQIHKNQPRSSIRRLVISFALLLVLFLIPIIGLNLLNYKFSHNFNLVTATYKLNLRFNNFIYLLGYPGLTLTNAESLFYDLYRNLLHPAQGIVNSRLWLGLSGLPAGLLIWWLIIISRILHKHKHELLAVAMFLTNTLVMFLIWSISTDRINDARHFVPGSMAILPFIIQSGMSVFKRTDAKIIKAVLLLVFIVYIVMPLVWEYVSIPVRRKYVSGPSRIYNSSLAHRNLPAVLSKLMQDFNPATDVWFLPDPVSALDIPGRAMIEHVDYTYLSSLQKQKLLTRSPCRVHALIPVYCEENGKAEAIRAAFVQAQGWSKKVIEDSDYACWTTTLVVTDRDKN